LNKILSKAQSAKGKGLCVLQKKTNEKNNFVNQIERETHCYAHCCYRVMRYAPSAIGLCSVYCCTRPNQNCLLLVVVLVVVVVVVVMVLLLLLLLLLLTAAAPGAAPSSIAVISDLVLVASCAPPSFSPVLSSWWC
jgi:hypothetical protein